MKNLDYKLQVLNEIKGENGLKQYIIENADSDPNFFRWLFDEDFDNDFDSSMTDEQKQEYKDWLDTL